MQAIDALLAETIAVPANAPPVQPPISTVPSIANELTPENTNQSNTNPTPNEASSTNSMNRSSISTSSSSLNANPAPDMNDPLPNGWEQRFDQNGRIYYIDHISKTTTWNKPSIRGSIASNLATRSNTPPNTSLNARRQTNVTLSSNGQPVNSRRHFNDDVKLHFQNLYRFN